MVEKKELETDIFQENLAKKFSQIELKLLQYQTFWLENVPKITYLTPETVSPKSEKEQPSKFKFFSFWSQPEEEKSIDYSFKPSISKSEVKTCSIKSTPFDSDKKLKGMYIFGNSGTGKTFLSTRFFDQLKIQHKMKTHFFTFMDQIHQMNFENSQVRQLERHCRSVV